MRIKEFLEAHGLHTLPLRASLQDLDRGFDRFYAVVDADYPNQDSHYLVLVKTPKSYYVVDPPSTHPIPGPHETAVAHLEGNLHYAGTALVVSDRPLAIPSPAVPQIVSWGALAVLGVVLLTGLWRRFRGHRVAAQAPTLPTEGAS